MKVLVTGGTGYIGSHNCIDLLNCGHDVVVADNLSNSKIDVIDRVKEITGKSVSFYKIDIMDKGGLENIFRQHDVDAVIHFAGLKAVGESVTVPLRYYHNNITGSIILFKLMQKYHVKKMIFSSSATVYSTSDKVPYTEDTNLGATNPYGRTKLMIEEILRDYYASDKSNSIAILRYFNPVGAHPSGLIGEDPNGIPNNLLPYVSMVAAGKLPELSVYGNDYNTPDGTGIRDYIHVTDLSDGHIKALDKISEDPGLYIYNLGTGKGYSVLEVVRAFESASNRKINYKIVDRRPGDSAISYADPTKAKTELNWEAKRSLEKMCEDAWRWQQNNSK